MRTISKTSRRGTIFVTAMWVTIIIGAVVLVFARSMRVELTAAANRAAADQADAIEGGVEQYVMAAVDNIDGEADYVLSLPGEQCRLGDGYFWMLRPSANQQNYEFGITDEASKFNLNYNMFTLSRATNATSMGPPTNQNQLILLPGMTSQQADSIIDWLDTESQNVTGGDGAENAYYEALPEPYDAKNANLETVEELMLIQGFGPGFIGGPDPLYGIDRNRNGVIEPGEMSQGSTPTNSLGETGDRGIFPFVTIYSQEPDVDLQGQARVNCTGVTAGGGGGGGNNAANSILQQLKNKSINVPGTLSAGLSRAFATVGAQGPITSVFDLAQRGGINPQDLATVADELSFRSATAAAGGGRATSTSGSSSSGTTANLLKGLININTAPREVLMTLTGVTGKSQSSSLTQNDVDNIISERQRADTSTIMWLADTLSIDKCATIGSYLTARSFVYSADIVAVSGDGRAFKRVRIVVDATQSPPKIIYRKDLTSFGWPLPESVRTSLRQGKGPGPSLVGGNGGFGGTGGGGLGGGMGR